MAEHDDYKSTPSIIQRTDIGTARPGQKLRYADLTASEKRDYLFDQGIRPTAYGTGDNGEKPDVIHGLLQFSEAALQSVHNRTLSQTLTRVSDELEEPKRKLFHTYGATAKIAFVPETATPYTGLFAQRASGLARFSYAGPVLAIGVVPGLGLKFLLDGDRPSQNLVAMRKLDRQQPLVHALSQDSHNSVFQNPFTNFLPDPSMVNVTMQVVKQRFETVVERGTGLHQPVDNLASVSIDGTAVPAGQVRAPYRLIFQPTQPARSRSDPTIDFRDDLARNIVSGMTIYDVFALEEGEENKLRQRGVVEIEDFVGHARKIGTIVTESEFIASRYGDYRLFFQHNTRFLRDEFKKP
jgi:hypothetical protein